MLGRLATYVVPTLSIAITAAVLLGPGATRRASFVRVYGAPSSATATLALRIEGAQRLYGVDEKASFENLSIDVIDAGTHIKTVPLSLGPDGIGEVLIHAPGPLVGPIDLVVRHGKRVLARGDLELRPASVLPGRARVSPLRLPGQTSGNLKMDITVRRGVLAAPFPDVLDVRVGLAEHVSPSNQGFHGIELDASAPGATIEPKKFVTDEHGATSIIVTPHAHHIELTITGKHPGHGTGRWEGTLPVIPGAIWLEPRMTNGLAFVSPAPRDRAYVSVMNESERMFGAIVSVSKDEQAMYRGRLELPKYMQDVATHIVVAGDPQEQGAGTVAWPLRSGEIESSLPMKRLLDGAEAAEALERGRASRVRRLALLVVVATMIFEVLFILVKSRSSQQSLEANLVRMSEEESSSRGREPDASERRAGLLASARHERPVLRVALAVSLVLVAFSMIAALSTLQW